MVSVANGSQFGNNFYIAPLANIQDGNMELVILKKFPWYAAPIIALKFFARKNHTSRYFETFSVKEFTLKQSTPLIHLDGEPLMLNKNLHFKINPLSLKVIVP